MALFLIAILLPLAVLTVAGPALEGIIDWIWPRVHHR